MDAQTVGHLEILQVSGIVVDLPLLVEENRQGLGLRIHRGNEPDVPVKDACALLPAGNDPAPGELIVVPGLDDLVAEAENRLPPGQLGPAFPWRIQGGLEHGVQDVDPAFAPPPGGKGLNIPHRQRDPLPLRIAQIARKPPGDQGDDAFGGGGGGIPALEEEIGAPAV